MCLQNIRLKFHKVSFNDGCNIPTSWILIKLHFQMRHSLHAINFPQVHRRQKNYGNIESFSRHIIGMLSNNFVRNFEHHPAQCLPFFVNGVLSWSLLDSSIFIHYFIMNQQEKLFGKYPWKTSLNTERVLSLHVHRQISLQHLVGWAF